MNGTDEAGPAPGPVLVIGNSAAVRAIAAWARRHGLGVISRPDRTMLCAVADESALHGSGSGLTAELVRQAHDLGRPCLGPAQAGAFLASAVYGPHGAREQIAALLGELDPGQLVGEPEPSVNLIGSVEALPEVD